jgi:hypothetical protein
MKRKMAREAEETGEVLMSGQQTNNRLATASATASILQGRCQWPLGNATAAGREDPR